VEVICSDDTLCANYPGTCELPDLYTWDREYGCLRMTGIAAASPGLPADLASFHVEGAREIPVFLLASVSLSPGTRVQARVLGALGSQPESTGLQTLPSDGWVFVAVAENDPAFSDTHSIELLMPALLHPLQAYVEKQGQAEDRRESGAVQISTATGAASLLRETRLELKRQRRMQSKERHWNRSREEQPVAWRTSDTLPASLLVQMQRDASLRDAPFAQTEYLIRFVPQRFQHALADLLLDDEHVLAFLERPLLRHRTGWLGIRTWRSNAGLFLVTDRQILWLRDFLTPGKGMASGGYIAHSAPLHRLGGVALLPAGDALATIAGRLYPPTSPYLRLVLEGRSVPGSELFAVEFPQQAEVEKALGHLTLLLQAFLPSAHDGPDRRILRLPQVSMWMPQGIEAARLRGLGGIVPNEIVHHLEQSLAVALQSTRDDVLVSVAVPALEEYKTPARLVALTRQAFLLLEEHGGKPAQRMREVQKPHVQVYRYNLSAISSAQLRYSLLGSSLSLFLPHAGGQTRQLILPFHSPAIAWFLPLFIRLRLLLTEPC
jgi:hypothetical protein